MTASQQQSTDLDSDPIIVPTDGASVTQRHPLYYIELVLFKVDTTLYRVQKHGFLYSNPKFFDRFNVPSDNNSDASDSNPIELNGVTSQAFEGLMVVLYPMNGNVPTYEAWLGALELATQWDMPDIRTRAIDALTNLHQNGSSTNTEIINLAKKYGIKTWLKDEYVKLVQNHSTRLEDLVGLLDNETLMRIFATQSYLFQDLTPPTTEASIICNNCTGGHGFTHCDKCCYQKGRYSTSTRNCDNCRNNKAWVFCELYCPRQHKPQVGLQDRAKVEAEIDRVFTAEFSFMGGIATVGSDPH
ncbi:hypothetical protein CPB83DRAFT_857922 [Crepidotus variabilis]|uniref:BTB domain-containing protein n=1 Tax=Crepidotus variabilis TaxID=179855 RepID=A0A9P6EC21_9AGAR|nr:hypothetical protein CPB83DRAFT_857922 [Crepidotus variabilis]